MALPLAAGAVLILILLVAHKRRWFARFHRGVFLSAAATIVTVALISAAVIGTWGYEAARRLMLIEMNVALDSIASIIQQQIDGDVQRRIARMSGLSRAVANALGPRGDLNDLTSSLKAVQSSNPQYLEILAVDANGMVVASTNDGPLPRPSPDRIAVAFNLEGKPFVSAVRKSAEYNREVIYISVPAKDASGKPVGTIATFFDLQGLLQTFVLSTKFNESGYAVVVGPDGRILAHPDEKRIDEDISSYAAVKAAAAAPSGEIVAANAAGSMRRFMFKQLHNPQTIEAKPWVLLTEINESEALAPLDQLRDELVAGVMVVVALGLLIAWSAARSLNRPLHDLEEVAHAVQNGDLTRTSHVEGKDAFSRLGGSLDDMIKGLRERDRVKDVFGRYIAKQAAERMLNGGLELAGDAKRVTVVFSDIRGFTSMAETMAPEQVVSFLNMYFSEMVDAVMEQEGILDKFLGDGLMAVFGSFGDQPDHARRAVLASLRMKALLAKINGERAVAGRPPIAIGVGIHTAQVIVGNIGSKQRLEFTHIGDGVNTASRVQALNKDYNTTILITGETYKELDGQFETRPIAEVTLRGKTQSLPIYEVVSAGTAAAHV